MNEADPTGKKANEPGAKLDAGKVRPSLVLGSMPRALLEVARVGTYGAEKYSEGGWQEVPDGIKRYTDAMDRHRLKEAIEPRDESGFHHSAQLAWNALARLELMLREEEYMLEQFDAIHGEPGEWNPEYDYSNDTWKETPEEKAQNELELSLMAPIPLPSHDDANYHYMYYPMVMIRSRGFNFEYCARD